MKRMIWRMVLTLTLLLTACQTNNPTVIEGATPTKLAVTETALPPTLTATITPTRTATPTATPKMVGQNSSVVKVGTDLPDVQPMTLENVDQLELLAQWGYGKLYDVQLTPDETQIVAATTRGVYWFDANTLEELAFSAIIPDKDFHVIKISPSIEMIAFLDYDGNITYQEIDDVTTAYTFYIEDAWNLWFSPNGIDLFVRDGHPFYEGQGTLVWNLVEKEWREQKYPWADEIQFSNDGSSFILWKDGRLFFSDGTDVQRIPSSRYFEEDVSALSPDGQYIATSVPDFTQIRIWDTLTEEWIFDYCFDPDACYTPEESQIYSSKLAIEKQSCRGIDEVVTLKFTLDGKKLIILTSQDEQKVSMLYQIDLENFTVTSSERIKQTGEIILFSDNQRYLLWQQNGITMRGINAKVQSIDSTEALFNLKSWLMFSHDSTYLGSTSEDQDFRLWDIKSGIPVFSISSLSAIRGFVFFHQDSKVFLPVWTDGIPAIVDYETGEVETFPVFEDERCKSISPAISADDQILYYYTYSSGLMFQRTGPETAALRHTRFHPNISELAVITDSEINIYEYNNIELSLIKQYPCELCGRQSYTWDYLTNGEGFYCAEDDELEIIQETETKIVQFDFEFSYILPLFFSSNLDFVFLPVSDSVYIINLNTQETAAIIPLSGSIHDIAFSSDEKYLAVSTDDGLIHIFGVPTN